MWDISFKGKESALSLQENGFEATFQMEANACPSRDGAPLASLSYRQSCIMPLQPEVSWRRRQQFGIASTTAAQISNSRAATALPTLASRPRNALTSRKSHGRPGSNTACAIQIAMEDLRAGRFDWPAWTDCRWSGGIPHRPPSFTASKSPSLSAAGVYKAATVFNR